MDNTKYNEHRIRFVRLRNQLIWVFVIAVSLAVTTVFIFNERLSKSVANKEDIAYLINIAGRQRMLSQNIAKTSLILSQDSTAKNSKLKNLDTLLNLFRTSHLELTQFNHKLGNQKLDSLFVAIQPSFLGIIDYGHEFSEGNLKSLENLLHYERLFLPQMEEIVMEYELLGTATFNSTTSIISTSNFLVILIIIVSASGVFLITLKIVRLYSNQLERKSKETMRLNKRLNSFFQNTSDAIYELDADANFKYGNSTLGHILGTKTTSSKDYKIWDFVPDNYKPSVKAHYIEVLNKKQKSDYYEFPIKGKKGLIWIGQSVDYIYKKGRAVKAYVIAKNVTAIKKAQDAQIQILSTFIESSPAAVAMVDKEMKYIAASDKWLQDYKITRAVIGVSHYEVFPEIGDDWKAIHKKVLSGHIDKNDEAKFERSDGTYQYIKWEVKPWYNVDNTIGGLIMFTDDITSLVQQREELYHAKIETEKAANIKERFAYIASHDLQEPVRTIISLSDMFKEEYFDKLDKSGKQMLTFINESGQRMSNLIKGLLDYSRLGKDKDVEEVNLNHLISDIRIDLSDRIEKYHAQIISEDLPTVKGYAVELRSLFQNLIANAIKFSINDIKPIIEIKVEENNSEWKFSVADNGIGIDPKFKDKIFQIFQRANNKSYEGTGIGLAHCYRIVEVHGGKIWVESQLGEGSTFYFTISKDLLTV